MSVKHPVVAVTGSSGAGTTSVTKTFQHIFRREGITPALVEGDSFHRYDRKQMKLALAEAEAKMVRTSRISARRRTCWRNSRQLFREYGESGGGKVRKYLHDEREAQPYGQEPGRSPRGRNWNRAATCCSTRDCTARPSPTRSTSSAMPTCWSVWCRSSTWSGSRSCTGTRPLAATRARPSPTRSCAGCPTT